MVKKTLIWQPLKNCPFNQLEKVKDNRYAIVAAETIVIKSSEEESNSKWVDVGIYEKLNLDDYEVQGVIQNQQGIRLTSKYLVEFIADSRRQLIKTFNQAGFIQFSEIEEGFLLNRDVNSAFLENLNGVTNVSVVSILQRKEVQPTLVPTGIFIEEGLPAHVVIQPNPTKPYVLASNSFNSPQLYIPVKSATSANYTIIPKGEMVAELLLIKEVSLIKEGLQIVNV